MKKVLFLLFAMLFLGLASLYAQSSNEPIIIDKAIIGHNYYHGDKMITKLLDMKAIVSNDPLALEEVKKANAIIRVSNVLAFGGGIVLAAIGIGLSVLADSHYNKGAIIYNGNLGITSCGNSVEVDFGLVPQGVGVNLSI